MNTFTNRSQEDIVNRIREIEEDDYFGFERNDLVDYLDFDHAKPHLKEGATQADWDKSRKVYQSQEEMRELAKAEIIDYLEFAWDKANDCRGLSASRSMSHMRAWLWIYGDDAFLTTLRQRTYEYYGKPQLVLISEYFGVDWARLDDGKWRKSEDDSGIGANQALGR